MSNKVCKPTLKNPLAPQENVEFTIPGEIAGTKGGYEEVMQEGHDLIQRPVKSVAVSQIEKQHFKKRMTVWERIKVLTEDEPNILFQNWGKNLDGASLVTGILNIGGRDVAVYGHDFTVRAGSIDATNGSKLAKLFTMAGEKGIPVIGMNDSAGAFVPAGVGGLDGYAEAFTALRKISGVVPSIMCMFGFNAGGGSYLPRQGSFVIQPEDTFFGLTGPGVVKSVLGEDVTPEDLGGPKVHGATGVADLTVSDETAALRLAKMLLSYIPDNNSVMAPFLETSDPLNRKTWEINTLLKKAFNSPTGFNTPVDVSIIIQQICDHGDYFELQPKRAREVVTAFGRLGGNVVGFCANNSAVASGQIDCDSAVKIARFVRFCNIYNIPIIFIEDTTGFLPGRDQEARGIVQAGRSMLDSIVDVRTPRILLILRNAYGGAYASYNNYPTGADLVLALPTTRLAVMGPAGKEFVYKNELRKLRGAVKGMIVQGTTDRVAAGMDGDDAKKDAEREVAEWLKVEEAKLNTRYEKELMNPKEGLSLGSISSIVMPTDLREVLAKNMNFFLRHYKPGPMQSVQREFH
ncbi:acyl-CoA carboxylase subunit beta [Desulfuromonas acetoxidans]|uniref:Propionyl-CoA carboxylase n=1 Tax=Desulfuromonas acetoxidans (strain DSM 684 / 11070) TaxID=281689 RepID=Q1JVQ6_DESA6|nr:carboxyl transferase domain-containing protein [Desulfuromonas acetoxidans]EAT14320.1 Propionyl-CoA carboxylase [Desulfuromonas acetoxidans DSM 684]MBF0645799.1 acetyl-CoA carboxylase carboxyltransferase subunit [Desulfuromonas acetoxidans]NVD24813.1 acetyl-CoA carboxylase carboxyltransferase subunit [Desulfuromonas acetoxidans]NVE16858.1 acetyl-CoA carboxylase carboxyltransferase subunit [Desulfuromonas acetoxidans]